MVINKKGLREPKSRQLIKPDLSELLDLDTRNYLRRFR